MLVLASHGLAQAVPDSVDDSTLSIPVGTMNQSCCCAHSAAGTANMVRVAHAGHDGVDEIVTLHQSLPAVVQASLIHSPCLKQSRSQTPGARVSSTVPVSVATVVSWYRVDSSGGQTAYDHRGPPGAPRQGPRVDDCD